MGYMIILVGGFNQPLLKKWSSSVGMMKFPYIYIYILHIYIYITYIYICNIYIYIYYICIYILHIYIHIYINKTHVPNHQPGIDGFGATLW